MVCGEEVGEKEGEAICVSVDACGCDRYVVESVKGSRLSMATACVSVIWVG